MKSSMRNTFIAFVLLAAAFLINDGVNLLFAEDEETKPEIESYWHITHYVNGKEVAYEIVNDENITWSNGYLYFALPTENPNYKHTVVLFGNIKAEVFLREKGNVTNG